MLNRGVLGAFAAGIVLVGCGPSAATGTQRGAEEPCDLGAELAARAGSGAQDCGHAAIGASTASIDACVVEAFGNHSPFFAEYERSGTDSQGVFGLVGDDHGTVTLLLWDSDPSGGSGAAPIITANGCNGPSVDSTAGRDTATTFPLTCASMVSEGQVCG